MFISGLLIGHFPIVTMQNSLFTVHLQHGPFLWIPNIALCKRNLMSDTFMGTK